MNKSKHTNLCNYLLLPAILGLVGLSLLLEPSRWAESSTRTATNTQSSITWDDNPDTLKLVLNASGGVELKPGTFTYRCPDGNPRRVLGSGPYQGSSSICSAAVHAGKITTAGGEVTIQMKPGIVNYTGTTRNGITSESYTFPHSRTYDSSFEFVGGDFPKSCDNYNLGSGIRDKWIQAGGERGRLGCPTMDEAEAARSPKGTTGTYAQFSGGDGAYIIWHRNGKYAGRSFDVNGCIFKLYRQRGGPGSWLGYPNGDAYSTSDGSRQDFEGGFIAWIEQTHRCQSYPYERAEQKEGKYRWVSAGIDDCTGSDIGSSFGSAVPEAAQCNANTVGTVAICWDGSRRVNPSRGGAWCTYKSTAANPCRRPGANYGFKYVCKAGQ